MPYQAFRPVTSHAARVLSDVREQRHQHAATYLRVVLPAITVLSWMLLLLGEIAGPKNAITAAHYITVGALTVVFIVCNLLMPRVDSIRLALIAIVGQMTMQLYALTASSRPDLDAMLLIWPLIAVAYFARPRMAAYCGVTLAVIFTMLAHVSGDWSGPSPIPASSYVIGVAGLLVGFVMREGRRVELSLVAAMSRDRLALALARGIRLASSPREAIAEIGRSIGTATGADHAVVVVFEHDDDYVTDISTWTRPSDSAYPVTAVPDLDIASIDATLRHLVITCHGALTTNGTVTLLAPPSDLDERHAPTDREDHAVTESLRLLLSRLNATSGLLAPLPMGGRAVGAILLATSEPHEWRTHALPVLEQVAPQLGAGLAQVVLLRDQREALESLERLDRMRDRLIANVSHELRTPLTSTIGFIETLMRTDVELSDEQRSMLMSHARDGGRRLLALVEDLLALGSTRPESLDLEPHPVRIGDLVETTVRGIAPPPGRGLTVDVHEDAFVTVDRNRMLQVFSNLVVNAIRHGDGAIEIRTFVLDDTEAVVDVLDAGAGVAPEHVHELFLPFARFSTRSDSTGLGLAICRTIVEAHGGSIDYARVADGRTRFRVHLPM